MRWTWDPKKNRTNLRDHGLGFGTAELVFRDPLAITRLDPSSDDEERWQTVGIVGDVALFVVHTWPKPEADGEEVGRIINPRKAMPRERRAYEEGQFD